MFDNLLHYLKLSLITGLLAGMSYSAYAAPVITTGTVIIPGNSSCPKKPLTINYKVGDIGPGGGWIFFVDKDDQYPCLTYLEAAPTGTGAGKVWCDKDTTSIPATGGWAGKGVGRGQANTTAMLGVCTSGAANAADLYLTATKSDWFLPSLGELMLMYTNLLQAGVGGFATPTYWSSSEYDSDIAWTQGFVYGNQDYNTKDVALPVRAVRAF